jgi:hypothetical protein
MARFGFVVLVLWEAFAIFSMRPRCSRVREAVSLWPVAAMLIPMHCSPNFLLAYQAGAVDLV